MRTRSCGQTSVVSALASVLHANPDALRQRLREFYLAQEDKAGAKRQQIAVTTCFAPLLAWALSWWEAHQIALALDATPLGNRFYVLSARVLSRGCAIPVAGTVLQAQQKHAWRKEWLRWHTGRRLRLVSVFRQGWVRLLTALLSHQPLPQGRFIPEPWPQSPREAKAAQPPPKTPQQRAA